MLFISEEKIQTKINHALSFPILSNENKENSKILDMSPPIICAKIVITNI
jgi:hypothetical protein